MSYLSFLPPPPPCSRQGMAAQWLAAIVIFEGRLWRGGEGEVVEEEEEEAGK
jgi:hypothetical protein